MDKRDFNMNVYGNNAQHALLKINLKTITNKGKGQVILCQQKNHKQAKIGYTVLLATD